MAVDGVWNLESFKGSPILLFIYLFIDVLYLYILSFLQYIFYL